MEKEKSMKLTQNVMIGTFIVSLLVLAAAVWFVFQEQQPVPGSEISQGEVIETPTAETETATNDTVTPRPAIVDEFPTLTPPPTAVATETPVATQTVPPTETPLPTNTQPPLPTAVPATNTSIPPTNTAPPSGPQPVNANGLIGESFQLQDWRTSLSPGGQIWYEWRIGNTSGAGVPYSTLGIMPRRNGIDEVRWYQNNWGGNNDVMPPEGLSWPSWMSIPEAGDYTLRVVVCFDGFQTCLNGGGTFHTLSQEIPITLR